MTRTWATGLACLLALGCHTVGPVFDLSIPDGADVAPAPRLPAEELAWASTEGGPSLRALAISRGVVALPGERQTFVGRGLYDPSSWVQQATARAAGPYVGEAGVRSVLGAFVARDDADVYARAAVAARLGPLADDDPARVALSGAWRRARAPWARGALAFGALALGDADAERQAASALAQGDVGLELGFVADVGASGREALALGLADGQDAVEEELSVAYAAARVALDDRHALAVLIDALSDPDPLVRLSVLDAVGATDRAVPVLRAARRSGPAVVREIAGLLRDAQRGRLTARFARALASEDAELRVAAVTWVSTAARGRPDEARPLLRAALGDEDAHVVSASARALGLLTPSADDLRAIRPLLSHEDAVVRVEAAAALLATTQATP